MDISKKVFLVLLAVTLFLVALQISSDYPTGLGIYYGNTSATNPEGTIRFTMANQVLVTLLNPPDNTIFTITGASTNVSLTCRATNLSGPVNITQIRLYTDISGAFIITDVINVSGSPPHTVTFNLTAVPLGTYRWNCEAVTATSLTRAPSDWRFTIRQRTTPGGGGGGGGSPWLRPPVIVEEAAYDRICVMPPHGLVSWFTFDETLADFWDDSRQGTMFNEPEYAKGEDKAAINLNGFTEQVIIDPEDTYNDLSEGTIEGWVYYKKHDDDSVIFSYSDIEKSGVAAEYLLLQINPAGNIEFRYKDGPTYRLVQPEFNFNFNKHDKEWVHFALTYANGRYEWYINGEHYGAVTMDSSGVPGYWFSDLAPGTELVATIGGHAEANSITKQFKGNLDEITLYNRPLNAPEIYSIYSRLKCKIKPVAPTPPTAAEIVEEIEQALEKPVLYLPMPRETLPLWIFAVGLVAIAIIIFLLSRAFMKKEKEKEKKKSRKHSAKKRAHKKKKK